MAALGKIRSKGVILICIIGFALFAFIAEELFRSCESSRNEQSMRVGEVLGEKMNVNDFQVLVDEYTNVMKYTQGRDNFNDEELSQIKDMAWNNYVQQKLIEDECNKLGLTVTDKELQDVLVKGENPMLAQTPFVNQETGRFDINLLKNFLTQYKQASGTNPQIIEQLRPAYTFWRFVEKNLRHQLLSQKYQALLAGCMLSNEITEKAAFEAQNVESSVKLASFAYSSINDKDVKVEDSDLKAKYEELKEGFRQYDESRDIQYVDFMITPSSADITAINKDFAEYRAQLLEATDPTEAVRKAVSLVPYSGIAKTKSAYPTDVAAMLDSLAVGATSEVKENKADNTLNVYRLMSKTQLPDSVEYRAIQVVASTPEAVKKSADSIYTALQGGADFATVAKKYNNQTGDKQWITSAQYQNVPSLDKDTKSWIETLQTTEVNGLKKLELTNATLILQVTDRKALVDKYDVAVIKKEITFSNNTSTAAFNKFSEFVAKCNNIEDIKAQVAKYGYEIKQRKDIRNTEHYVAGIHSTREAMKWIFNADTKEGDVSPLYECGDNGDHYMVIVLDKIHEKGYRDLNDEDVKNYVQTLALNDKKAEKLLEKAAKCKSVAEAEKAGAKVSEVAQITKASPVFIPETGAQEVALSGAVAATAKGKFSKKPVKGNAGVYVFQVTDKKNLPGKFDAKAMAQRLQQQAAQIAMQGAMNELMINADVKDNRYLFF